MGQGDGLREELLRSLLALFSLILWSRDSFAELEPVFPAERRFPAMGFFSRVGFLPAGAAESSAGVT